MSLHFFCYRPDANVKIIFILVMKEGDVEKELEVEDVARLRESRQAALHKSSPVKFIKDGLDLEDEQYVCFIGMFTN